MKIIPHIGFGIIKFGMSMKDVTKVLGKQYTEEIEPQPDGGAVHTLVYMDLMYSLTFTSEDDYKLGSITFYAEDTSVFGLQLIGLEEEEFLATVATQISDIELDDDFVEEDERDYVSDEHDISFWLQDGVVFSITVLPKYKDDGVTVLWPA